MPRLIDADKVQKMIEREIVLETGIKQSLVTKLVQIPTVDQWHYPSKGEYPTENGKYLVDWRGEYGEHIDIDQWSDGKWLYIGEVIAWQYIIPPKEEA